MSAEESVVPGSRPVFLKVLTYSILCDWCRLCLCVTCNVQLCCLRVKSNCANERACGWPTIEPIRNNGGTNDCQSVAALSIAARLRRNVTFLISSSDMAVCFYLLLLYHSYKPRQNQWRQVVLRTVVSFRPYKCGFFWDWLGSIDYKTVWFKPVTVTVNILYFGKKWMLGVRSTFRFDGRSPLVCRHVVLFNLLSLGWSFWMYNRTLNNLFLFGVAMYN